MIYNFSLVVVKTLLGLAPLFVKELILPIKQAGEFSISVL
jgi:hypothetical protein